ARVLDGAPAPLLPALDRLGADAPAGTPGGPDALAMGGAGPGRRGHRLLPRDLGVQYPLPASSSRRPAFAAGVADPDLQCAGRRPEGPGARRVDPGDATRSRAPPGVRPGRSAHPAGARRLVRADGR